MKYIIPILFLLINSIALGQPGSLDLTFNETGMAVIGMGDTDNCGHAIAIQSDGKIIVVGSPYGALGKYFITLRLNEDGSKDDSFGTCSVVATMLEPESQEEVFATVIQPDGNILVGGYSNGKFALVRYRANGTLDSTFATGGIALTPVGINGKGSDIAIQTDGRIVMTGSANNQFTTVRYMPDGTPDTSFGMSGIIATSVGSLSAATALSIQPDGKIVVAGNSGNDFALVRYQPDGSLDTTFGVNGRVITLTSMTTPPVPDVVVQNDGKILVAGGSYICNVALARYNTDGTPDSTFDLYGITICSINSPASASSLTLQPDGKIITSGFWSPGNQILYYAMCRLNKNGSLDTTFGINGCVHTAVQGEHDVANAILVQEDGRILLAGCSHYPGSINCDFAVVRYNGGALGMINSDDIHQFYIYPNPAKDKILIEIKIPEFPPNTLGSIYNIRGDLQSTFVMKTNRTEISIDDFPQGIYLVRLIANGKTYDQTFIIER